MDIIDVKLAIFESALKHEISDDESEFLLAALEASEIKNALVQTRDGITNGAKTVYNTYSKATNAVGTTLHDGLDKSGRTLAMTVLPKPKMGEDGHYPEEQFKRYQTAMDRIIAGWKVAGMIAIATIPIPAKIAIESAILRSAAKSGNTSDQVFKKIYNKISSDAERLKERWLRFINKHKDKKVEYDSVKTEINSLNAAGANLTKQMDSANKQLHAGKSSHSVNEATMKLTIDHIFTEKSYDEFIGFIEVYEYTNPTLNNILDYYLDNTKLVA